MAGLPFGFKSSGGLKLAVRIADKAIKKAFTDVGGDLATANTKAMRDIAQLAKAEARAAVRKGGGNLGRKWPNAVRAQAYPEKGRSMKPSAAVWVRSDYAGIFEEGGTVRGQPWLWVPLKGVPPMFQRKRIRPGLLKGLITIRRPGKPPLLGIRIKATEKRATGPITTSMLARGTAEKFSPKKRKKGSNRIRVIPLFVGIRAATIAKKWDITGAVARAGRQLDARIAYYLRGSNG